VAPFGCHLHGAVGMSGDPDLGQGAVVEAVTRRLIDLDIVFECRVRLGRIPDRGRRMEQSVK